MILALHGFNGSADGLRRQLDFEVFALDSPGGWWRADEQLHYHGWTRTRARLEQAFAEHHFDAVLGFSQGAVLASLVAALFPVKRAVMIGGFPSRDPRHAELYATPLQVPSLHVIGMRDAIVSPNASRLLAGKFQSPIIGEHEGGHQIACLAQIREFLQ